jgi:hypothetical protein
MESQMKTMKTLLLTMGIMGVLSGTAGAWEVSLGQGRVWQPGRGIRTEGPTLPGIGVPELNFYIPPKTMPGVWPMPAKNGKPLPLPQDQAARACAMRWA